MRTWSAIVGFIIAIALASHASAQTGAAVVGKGPGVAGAAAAAKPGEMPAAIGGRQVTVTAEVIDVDPAKQMVTLRARNASSS